MLIDLTLVEYAQLAQIAEAFGSQATTVTHVHTIIKQALEPLVNGDYQGTSALHFFSEMHATILPGFERLTAALLQAQTTVQAVAAQFNTAELEASRLFQPAGAFGAGIAGALGGTASTMPPAAGVALAAEEVQPQASTTGFWDGLAERVSAPLREKEKYRALRERGAVSAAQAQQIFADMADEPDIPYAFTDDGCYARAHAMTYRISERYGIGLDDISKVFIDGDLEVPTPYRYEQITLPDGSVVESSTLDGTVNWAWHVAPVIKVRQGDTIVDMVIDPSLAAGPITIDAWKQIMNDPDAVLTRTDYRQYKPHSRYENETEKQIIDISARETLESYLLLCEDEGYCK